MITVTLPDSSQRQYDQPVTIAQVAQDIAPSLGKKALAGVVDGEVRDLNSLMTADATLRIITPDNDDAEALFVLRHSCAHVMAEAVCDILPGTQLAYGPAIEDGFYYDMATPTPVTEEDFAAIEKRMKEIVKANRPLRELIAILRPVSSALATTNISKTMRLARSLVVPKHFLSMSPVKTVVIGRIFALGHMCRARECSRHLR